MKEEEIGEEIDELQQNEREECANNADSNADKRERDHPQVSREIGQTGHASSRVSGRHGSRAAQL